MMEHFDKWYPNFCLFGIIPGIIVCAYMVNKLK